MPLPRNALSRNTNTHTKKDTGRQIIRKTTELDTICSKHKVGILTFRSCKFADAKGNVTFVEHNQVRANMKYGIMVIKANNVVPSASENIYDLVQIEKDKYERNEKKNQEEAEKALIEIERLKNTNTITSLPNESDEHTNLLKKIVDESNDANQIMSEQGNKLSIETTSGLTEIPANIEKMEDQMENEIEQIKILPDAEQLEIPTNNEIKQTEILPGVEQLEIPTNNETEQIGESKNQNNDDKQHTSTKKDKSAKAKREKALKQMQEQLEKQSKSKGNRHYRNFMKDVKSKFSLTEKPEYKFFEVRAETTDMVISDVKTYEIIMPINTKETYLLVLGDLQMKTGLIRQIDPAYKSEKVFKEQNDFLERIKAKEKSKTTALSEDLLEEELDDLDELGISDDEKNIPKLAMDQTIDNKMVDALLNPELLSLKKSEESVSNESVSNE
jgi:uncharacterized protein YbjQ (UPF0145 family)